MRKKILAANWKMNLTHSEAESYLQSFLTEIGEVNDVEVVILPPFTAIPALVSASDKMPALRVGAQNMHWEKSGAYTGEVSATMLRALYVKYVVLGHSERRTLFGETDEIVNRKVRAALDAGLRPIFCIGESLHERDCNEVEQVLGRQLRSGLEGVSQKDFTEIVVAYEPCWAIGTGRLRRRLRPKRLTPLFVPFWPNSRTELLRRGSGSNTAGASNRTMPRSSCAKGISMAPLLAERAWILEALRKSSDAPRRRLFSVVAR